MYSIVLFINALVLFSVLLLSGCTSREETMNAVNGDNRFGGYTMAGHEYSGFNDTIADVHHAKGLECSYCHPAPIADSMLFRKGHSPDDRDVTEACRSCHTTASEKNDFHQKHWSASSSSGQQIPCRECHLVNAPRPDSFPFVRLQHKIIRPNISEWNSVPYPRSYCLDCHYFPSKAKGNATLLAKYKTALGQYNGLPAGPPPDIHHIKGKRCTECHSAPIADSMLFRNSTTSDDKEVTAACKSCHTDVSSKNNFHSRHWSNSAVSGKEIPCRECHIANAPPPDSFPFVKLPHRLQLPDTGSWNSAPHPAKYCIDCHYSPAFAKGNAVYNTAYKKALHEFYGSNNTTPDVHHVNEQNCTSCHPAYIKDSALFKNTNTPDDKVATAACLQCHASARTRNGFHEKHWPTSTNESEALIPCRVCHVQNSPRPDEFSTKRIPHKIRRPSWSTDPPFEPAYCSDCHSP
ncbi:MAG: hypothetical protein JNL74_01060 [Fibrobacteres bacterium]|nr:hypothetical protein [Fibrobacterota bacterium]